MIIVISNENVRVTLGPPSVEPDQVLQLPKNDGRILTIELPDIDEDDWLAKKIESRNGSPS